LCVGAIFCASPADSADSGTASASSAPVLRVCADPDNLPYSHADGSGFENRIAQVLAEAMGATLESYWFPLRRGFVSKAVGAGHCDVVIGVPAGFKRLATTRPYYRSHYVFVTRADERQPLRDFTDPRLASLRVGVQLVGDDLAATPPGHALARHGAVERVVGFNVYGDRPAAERMVRALAKDELDAAVVWGPQAGYFVSRAPVALSVRPARAPDDLAELPFEFDIAVGVRRGDAALRDRVQAALDARHDQIDAILADYRVPRTDRPAGPLP
jgi:quinoprotein dehydrogenase-associated probable ABC transporter substrate-binding protein